jgi:succinate-semialdehyde dehydrogenase/glutarate-semialdehyde dehydrogenase
MATQTVHQMFLAGSWQPSASGETFDATSPATGQLIATVPRGDRGDATRAIHAARAAADGWARVTAFERAAKMHAVGDLIEARRDDLARTLTLDQGKPMRAEAFDEVAELVEYWRMAAEDAKRLGGELPNSFSPGKRVMLARRPRGVVGVISPWNWPYTMPAELIAPALACGNAVVWTPAPSTAVCAVALAECVADADLPPGVFNLVTGPGPVVGDEIARNPGTDGVAFIGSTATGRLVGQAAAGKATLLEMGGNGPLVVMDDADVEAAVPLSAAERALTVLPPRCTGSRRSSRTSPPTPASRSRRRSVRSRRWWRSTRSSTRSTSPTPRRTGCSRRYSPPASKTGSSSPTGSTRAG